MNQKIRKLPVDWVTIYSDAKKPIWKVSPHTYTAEAIKHCKGKTAIDIGCGEGHDALSLIQNGYITTAIDVSPEAIRSLEDKAGNLGLNFLTKISDASKLSLTDMYDVVVSYGFLHFVGKDSFAGYVQHLKDHTNQNGIHSFYTFGDMGNFYDIAKHKYWFPSQKSLAELYSDWKVIKVEEKTTKMFIKGDNGEDLYNSLIKILVQKM